MRISNGQRAFRPRLTRVCALLALGAVIPLTIAACGEDEAGDRDTTAPAGAAIPYRLSADEGTLIGPGSQKTPVKPATVTGFVDNVIPEGEVINVSGWAATANHAAPAKLAIGIVDGVAVGKTKPTAQRPDVVEAFDAPAIRKSGFALFVETSSLDCSASAGGLTVLGIADGVASPLTFVGNSVQMLDEAC